MMHWVGILVQSSLLPASTCHHNNRTIPPEDLHVIIGVQWKNTILANRTPRTLISRPATGTKKPQKARIKFLIAKGNIIDPGTHKLVINVVFSI